MSNELIKEKLKTTGIVKNQLIREIKSVKIYSIICLIMVK